ncbi:hypothetical protein PBY51_009101 [Eleginops maclovinus]|uniref:Uncharacterized protein n=1 Tax=Eleginops maclovinus TaxID=56733 RepID=A0AAN7WYE9_ELEMC|nr:hypothetical protein PBY51_009101 [Eleginops maclovinus]
MTIASLLHEINIHLSASVSGALQEQICPAGSSPPLTAEQHLDAADQKSMYMLACIFYYSHLISLGNYSLHRHVLCRDRKHASGRSTRPESGLCGLKNNQGELYLRKMT